MSLMLMGVVALLMLLVFLVLRFVHPELVYIVRNELRLVQVRRLFIERERGVKVDPSLLRNLLTKDTRRESGSYTGPGVRSRLIKTRELLRSLESHLDSTRRYPPGREPNICLVELADLLKGVADKLQPSGKGDHDVVQAAEFLRLIAAKHQPVPTGGDPAPEALLQVNELEAWFETHLISIEQSVELVYAVVYALSFRIDEHTPHG